MNRHPIEVREILAQFPQFTQRFWTWLTAITRRGEPARRPWTVNQHMVAFVCMAAAAIGLAAWSSQTLVDLAVSQAHLAANVHLDGGAQA